MRTQTLTRAPAPLRLDALAAAMSVALASTPQTPSQPCQATLQSPIIPMPKHAACASLGQRYAATAASALNTLSQACSSARRVLSPALAAPKPGPPVALRC